MNRADRAGTTSCVRRTIPVDISEHFNNVGFSPADQGDIASFNIWSNSFPIEQVPWTAPHRVQVADIEFALLADGLGTPDNVRCDGQLLEVPVGKYDWLHVLAAAERRSEDRVSLHFDRGVVDPEWLRVSDFWPETSAWFGERAGIRFSELHYPRHVQRPMSPAMWLERIPVARRADLTAIRLPENPAVHVFAMVAEVITAEGADIDDPDLTTGAGAR